MSTDVQQAIEHLDMFGYCVLDDRIPPSLADAMAKRFLQLHAEPQYQKFITGDEHYQTLFGMLNLDDRVWTCASHPDVVAVASRFLGPNVIVAEACSKPTWPGASHGGLHVDSAHHFNVVPDVPWLINTIWMLTDFTVDNGATGIVPMSHRSRRKSPPQGIAPDGPLIRPMTGTRGSVAMWHAGSYHMSRANTTNDVRVGLNIAYYPRWFNVWIEGGHQPTWPETYERMPPEMKRLCPGRLGHKREDVYELF